MSVEAISLALSIPVERSSAKFVLVAMANCANNDMICWPSIQYLSDATSQDRKTVIKNIKRLREYGLIEETGEKRGSTGQISVFRLTIKESQKRNSTENGTVPKTEPKSTVFSHKESRFSVERVPKTGHGTVKEPSKEPSVNHKGDKSLGFDPLTMVLPDCVSNASWAEWVAYRRERKLTVTKSTMESQASRLSGWSSEGYDPTEVIQESISNGWQGLFKPKNKPSTKTKSGALSKAGASTAAAVERWLTSEAV